MHPISFFYCFYFGSLQLAGNSGSIFAWLLVRHNYVKLLTECHETHSLSSEFCMSMLMFATTLIDTAQSDSTRSDTT